MSIPANIASTATGCGTRLMETGEDRRHAEGRHHAA